MNKKLQKKLKSTYDIVHIALRITLLFMNVRFEVLENFVLEETIL